MYSKATETAIAAMTRLAEVWDNGKTRLSAADIADNRNLQRPFVSKVLSTLSQAGLVTGTRGPGGGFCMSRPPREITLYQVYRLFEREDHGRACPFGGGVCGAGPTCSLHDKLVDIQLSVDDLLHETTFEAARKAYQEEGLRPTIVKGDQDERRSFRAQDPRIR